MELNRLCVTIPVELQNYQKVMNIAPQIEKSILPDFGVKTVRDESGNIECIVYYSDIGELTKKVYYSGSTIKSVKYYKDNMVRAEEIFSDNKASTKIYYDIQGNIAVETRFYYNQQEKIREIAKIKNKNRYSVEYGYDELGRVNSRKISINGNPVVEQKYRFDILDRLVEYHDNNQAIKVHQMSPENELIYYTITDKMGNDISVTNHFANNKYVRTDIKLNGHEISIRDKGYLDNIMLKKPYTSEDDLDFIISNLFRSSDCTTKRTGNTDISNNVINSNIQPRVLPISMRKRLLIKL